MIRTRFCPTLPGDTFPPSHLARTQTYFNPVQKRRRDPQQQHELHLTSASSLLLRSLQFGTALVTALVLALVLAVGAYITFYQTVRVKDLGGRHRVDLQYGHYRTPYASIQLPPGKYDQSNQPYDVQLELVVPLTPRNLAIGNFMVSLELRAQDGATLINISRPASLRQPDPSFFSTPLPHVPLPEPSTSLLFKPFKWAIYLIPNPFAWILRRGISEESKSHKKFQPLETERVIVPLVSHSALRPHRSTFRTVAIEVGRRDAHLQKGECGTNFGQEAKWDPEGELHVYESWLGLQAHLTGLRYLLHYHPYLSFLTFFPLFLFVELSIAFLVWIGFVISKDPSKSTISIGGKRPPPPPSPASRLYDTTEEDSKVGIKHEHDDEEDLMAATDDGSITPSATVSLTPSGSGNGTSYGEGEDEGDRSSRFGTARRVGMVDISGSSQRDEEESFGSGTEDGLESASQVGARVGGGEVGQGTKSEEGDDMVTLGGSETTRATGTSFGPSLAATSATTATETSSSRVRSRLGGVATEEDD
ncbi:BQ5605_C015g07786 [Microbotryum silenes-dioicae]|uniref:BQ5605_C015g07786 protein n=1 Tax=Microbotryum silenes-dioicae TaxID=796604 RepID=A0A2X0NX80_9BASI|nr:BQ5605_C015g07786 [Microbotryum silenes-dioicae]